MIKAVLFDLDGTLLDTSEGVLESAMFAAKELGYQILSPDIMRSFVGPPIQLSFKKHYGCNDEQAQQAANIFRDYYKNKALLKATPYDGMEQMLMQLKENGIKIGVATYKREDYAITILNHFNISPFCVTIHGADNYNVLSKSDIINICIKELQLNNKEIVLVGDTEHDALGAEKAGVSFIGVTYGFGFNSIEDVNHYSNIGQALSITDIHKIILKQL